MTTTKTKHTQWMEKDGYIWNGKQAVITGLTDGKLIGLQEDIDLACSAPELLEALKSIVNQVRKNESKFEDNDSIFAFIEDAQDAISKAEGQL